MHLRFDGQLILVSGAGHGLGRAIALAFAGLGARVHGCSPYPADLAEDLPGIALAQVDLADRAAAAAWARDAERQAGAPVAVLVNNAGGVQGQAHQPIETVSDADWDAILAANLGAAFALSRAVVPGMKRARAGRIVTISSGAGLQASLTGIQAYCSAKHAVIGLTRQLAHELGPHGITVNSVAPGLIVSNPDTQKQWDRYGDAGRAAMVERIALRRLGTPEDIANAVLFFASPLAAFVNGQVLSVDGGR
jgi:3-oxoacyl-[acyl-carrier protein] reductase